jgi:membrane-bound ClpP family serine protease
MVAILVLVAVLGLLVGVTSLSNATAGVGIIGAACLLAIFARIAQAGQQHDRLIKALKLQTDVLHDAIRPSTIVQ